MNQDNYINLDLTRKDNHIYRIISIDRLLLLFSTKENVLVNPRKWDDPFENFILNSKVRLQSGELASFDFRDNFYGQCWTRHKASDAMWRIYSPKSNGVRIRTTIPKLANSLSKTLGQWSHISCFMGKVKYLNNKKMMDFANTIFKDVAFPKSNLFAETLLIKRPAFKHENEVRLLYFERENNSRNDLYKYSFDPHEVIDQVMIDPRVDYKTFLAMKASIKNKTGFKGKILRSLLYAPPKDMIFPFG